MQHKNYIKICLDVVMTILLILLFNKRAIGMKFHEISGLVVGALFLAHLGLNWQWVVSITKKFFGKNLKLKTRIGYVINFLLFLSMGFIILSGIMISKTILTNISSTHIVWKIGHHFVAALALILVGIHVGLHWTFIKSMFKKILRIPATLGSLLVVLTLVAGGYSMATSSFTRWLTMPFNISQGAGHGEGKGQGRGETPFQGGKEGTTQGKTDADTGPSASPRRGSTNKSEAEGSQAAENNLATSGNQMEQGQAASGNPQQKGMDQGSFSLSRIGLVIFNFLSIMSSFAILTVWVEKLCTKKIKKGLNEKN